MDEEPKRGGPPKPVGEMASRALSTIKPSTALAISGAARNEPARLDDAALANLAQIASAPLAPLEPADKPHIMQSLAVLDAALPRRARDEVSGKLMAAAYHRKLAHLPVEQFDFMCNAILERCEWFPTISECLKIAGEWVRRDAAEKARAARLIEREDHLRMIEAHRRLRWGEGVTQAEVDSWPAHWREAAATPAINLLHRDPQRLHQIRARQISAPPALLPPPTTEDPK